MIYQTVRDCNVYRVEIATVFTFSWPSILCRQEMRNTKIYVIAKANSQDLRYSVLPEGAMLKDKRLKNCLTIKLYLGEYFR